MRISESVLAELIDNRGKVVHVIDPFKVTISEAIEKAIFFSKICSFIIIGSTDCDNFDQVVPKMVEQIKRHVDINVLTHFPPKPGLGYPTCKAVDGIIATSVLNSSLDYYKNNSLTRLSLLETIRKNTGVTILPCLAITLGDDRKSKKYVYAEPVDKKIQGVDSLLNFCELPTRGLFYLFSRHQIIDKTLVSYVRSRLDGSIILFASGCIQTKQQAHQLLQSGADYVAVGSLFEKPNWVDMASQFFKNEKVNS